MSDRIEMNAETRSVTGKAVRRLRRDGIIPVVVYGGKLDDALSLQVAERELQRVLQQAGTGNVIYINVDGANSYPALARAVDRHPTRNDILHADFLAVRLDRLIRADVQLVAVGESLPAVNNEAILMQEINTITVEALPQNLPSQVQVDVSGLTEIGQQLTIADLNVSDEVTIIAGPDTVIVSLAPPVRVPVDEEEAIAVEDLDEAEMGETVTAGEDADEEIEAAVE